MGGCDGVEGNGMIECKQVTCVNYVAEVNRWVDAMTSKVME